jgi:ABC-type branched-subunit amino acid transport system substrate-binding protein
MTSLKRRSAAAALVLAATTSVTAGCSSDAASVDVIKIGVVQEASGAAASDYLMEWGIGAQAAVDYINEDLDGFGGRKVELIVCDAQSSAAGALTCANRFVTEKVAFVTGLSLYWGANGISVLERAGIPSQTAPISVQDASSPISFPYGGGVFSELPAATTYAVDVLEANRVAAAVYDGVGNDIFFDRYRGPVDEAGGEFTEVLVPPTGDMSPSIANAISADPDVVVTPISNTQLIPYYEGLHKQGFDMTHAISVGAAVDADNFFDLVKVPESIEGTVYTYEFKSFDDVEDPEVKTFRDAMEKYSDVAGRGEFYQWSFATVITNYHVAEEMGFDKFGAKSLINVLENDTVPVFMGHEFSKKKYATDDAPGIGNPWIRFVEYRDGKVTDLTEGWLNGFTGEVVTETAP